MTNTDPQPADAPLAGRKALVVGVETTTGTAIASALGAAGADVALAVMRADEGVLTARRLQRELRELGRTAMTYALDVTLGQNARVTTRQVAKELGGLDIVVSAADDPMPQAMADTSEMQLAQAMTMNCYSHAYVARAAFGEFRRGGRGSLLIVTHALGDQPAAGAGVYALACAATLGLARTLVTEHDEPGVAITTLLRGAVALDATAGNLANAIADADEAEADALARLAVHLASSAAEDVTGRVFSAADAP
ncbi:MAG: SDR family NAD(P)-dependent oxidoreductase [Chloroflexi bacterium]|nr:SDR family NAD(P)-dependent oxidoreductase [Chloroflexota bacterium]